MKRILLPTIHTGRIHQRPLYEYERRNCAGRQVFFEKRENCISSGLEKNEIDWQLYALLAVMLHELTSSRIQKISQTILYLPHFIS
ncbi:hypothetical protein NST83_24405 [Paenibacillus sp. FSL R10-2782]|uniref:hypothetical protein n=1 Tax=Paenibacillus sp. FSL R10-2782 TaxID=2954661 RepID=UPI0031598F1E